MLRLLDLFFDDKDPAVKYAMIIAIGLVVLYLMKHRVELAFLFG